MNELMRQVQTLQQRVATIERWERPVPTRTTGLGGPSISIADYGAKGDDTTDDTTAIAAAVAAIPTTGGTLSIPPRRHKITSTINIPSNVTIRGTWGGWRDNGPGPLNGSQLAWYGAANGTMLKVFNGEYIVLDGFALDGRAVSGVTGLLIDSNNGGGGGAPVITTHQVSVQHFSIDRCGGLSAGGSDWGVGIQLGTSGLTAYQSDGLYIGKGRFNSTAVGIDINSGNSADYSIVENIGFNGFYHGVRVTNGTYHKFGSLAFGSSVSPSIAFHIVGGHNPILIEQCQSESTTYFMVCDPNLLTFPITLLSNQPDNPILINGQTSITAVGNTYGSTFTFGSGTTVTSVGDEMAAGGSFVVTGTGKLLRLHPGQLAQFDAGIKVGGTAASNAVNGVFWNNAGLTFPLIAAGATSEQTLAVSGAAVGMTAICTPNTTLEAGLIAMCYAVASGITVRLYNSTGAGITPAVRQWRGMAFN